MFYCTLRCYAHKKTNIEGKKKRFIKLQSNLQTIVDQQLATFNRIPYTKWTIEEIGDSVSGKKFKVRMHSLSDIL